MRAFHLPLEYNKITDSLARFCPISTFLSLDGVELLPALESPAVEHHYKKANAAAGNTAVAGMTAAIRAAWNGGKGSKTWVVVTGPCTNAAELMDAEEDLVRDAVEGWVVMGGSFGECLSDEGSSRDD